MEDYEGAARHFRAAAEIDAEDRQARLELAVALSRLERREEALRELELLTAVAPDFVESRLALATLLGQLGRNAEAQIEVTAVLEGDASSAELAEAHLILARLVEPTDTEGALAHYATAVELNPGSVETGYELAMALGRQGRFSAAAQRFDSLVDLAPGDAELRLGQAMAHLLGEDYRGTRQVLEAALATFPGDAELTHSLARLLSACPDAEIRDGERAIELAQRALQSRQSLEYAETLAMALAETGRYSDAAALQRQVVDQRRRNGDPRRLSASERYLSFFEQGRPVRSPWLRGG
jgi:Flp pilus assembly protein TadD